MATFDSIAQSGTLVQTALTGVFALDHEDTLESSSILPYLEIYRARSGSAYFYFTSQNPIVADFSEIVVIDTYVSGQESFRNSE